MLTWKHEHDEAKALSLSLSLSRSRFHQKIVLLGVFLLCACVGVMAGGYIKHQVGDANAASENIAVTDNNQVSTVDQGTSQIVRTSTVIVKDTTATAGYILKARIENNSISNSVITIYSATSAICTQSSPCVITTDPTPITILRTNTTDAMQVAGHTTEWIVTITVPANTLQGNYILDIEYAEDPIIPLPMPTDPGTTLGAMQKLTNAACPTARGTAYDIRNGQIYYVQKINGTGSGGVGDLCWMETNLKYAGDGAWDASWGYADDRYATTAALAADTENPNDNTRPLTFRSSSYAPYVTAEYMDPGGSTNYVDTIANGGFYGYLYTWCAAMGGQPHACAGTSEFDITQSICPAGWRLPIGGGQGEYRALNAAINGSALNTDAGFRNNFLGVYSGHYTSALDRQGIFGHYWSSTVYSSSNAHSLIFGSSYVGVSFGGVASYAAKYYGQAVRCVLE